MAEINDLSVTDASNTARFPENQLPSTVNDGARALEGLVARWHKDVTGTLAATGSSNSWTITPNRTVSSLYDGLTFLVEAPSSVTSSATGFAGLRVLVSGSTAAGYKSAFFGSTAAVQTGDIRTRQRVGMTYDSSAGNWKIWSGDARPIRFATAAEMATGTEAAKAVTPAGVKAYIPALTAATTPAVADTIEVYVATSSAPRKMTLSNLMKTVNVLTEDTSPDNSNDFLLTYDASSSSPKKAKPTNLFTNAAASQSDMETATATNVYATPGRQHFHPGHPKAWVRFASRGTNGSCTISSSYNVSSVDRVSTGVYNVTFTNAMSAATFMTMCSVEIASPGTAPFLVLVVAQSTTIVQIGFRAGSTLSYVDTFDFGHVMVCGDI